MTAHVVALPMIWETPLRTGNLRDPNGPQVTFAFEGFIDELAAARGSRSRRSSASICSRRAPRTTCFGKARSLAVVRAAAEAYGWDARPSPKPREARAPIADRARHRLHLPQQHRRRGHRRGRGQSRDRRRLGQALGVRPRLRTGDQPEGLRHTVECGMLHALSRALWEEVQFDTEKVTSVDWASHPSLRHSDTPETIDVVLVNGDPNPNRPDLPPYGAGETSHKPVIAAVANAIHDATGVRLRRAPFRRERVLAALRAAAVVG